MKNYLRYSELALRKQTDRTKECHATFSITNYQAPTVKNYLRYSELALRKQTDRKKEVPPYFLNYQLSGTNSEELPAVL